MEDWVASHFLPTGLNWATMEKNGSNSLERDPFWGAEPFPLPPAPCPVPTACSLPSSPPAMPSHHLFRCWRLSQLCWYAIFSIKCYKPPIYRLLHHFLSSGPISIHPITQKYKTVLFSHPSQPIHQHVLRTSKRARVLLLSICTTSGSSKASPSQT